MYLTTATKLIKQWYTIVRMSYQVGIKILSILKYIIIIGSGSSRSWIEVQVFLISYDLGGDKDREHYGETSTATIRVKDLQDFTKWSRFVVIVIPKKIQ